MHNFGRGMWRRISDHEKHQEATDVQTNRLTHYFQTQKQRVIDAYSRIAISNEKKEVKEEVTMNDVSDNYVIVEAVVIEVETSVVSEAKEETSVIKEETSVLSEAKEETSVIKVEPSVSEVPVVTETIIAPVSKSIPKKRRKK